MRSAKVWVPLALLLGLVLVVGAWCGWTAYQVNQDLNAAVDDASALRDAVDNGDSAAMQTAVHRLQDHSTAAADRTHGTAWSVLTHLPRYGDDAHGVAVVSQVIADLSANGVEPLVQVSDSLDSIVPSGGRIDIAALTALQDPVAKGRAAFEDADRRLAAEDPTGYTERLRTKYRDLAGEVADARRVLDSADTAVQVLPGMLGQGGATNYLLVFQNNAEIRSTGGLPGAVSLVHADDGKVTLTRQVAANTFGFTSKPVLPLTAAERAIYDVKVGTFFLDANFQPDFPRASDLWKARWEQVYPERLKGVISIDPVALSYVLGATGPLTVGDVTLTQDNAVDELLHGVYVRHPSPAAQDVFFRKVARAFFDKISGGVASPQELVRALSRAVTEHRLYVHDFDPAVQSRFAGTAIAGELVTDPKAAPQVGVYLNDATGAKMSYYLRHEVDVDATYCTDDSQGLTGHASLMSEAPLDAGTSLPRYVTGGGEYGTEAGNQTIVVNIYGPVGGSISALALNGKPLEDFPPVNDRGRMVATVFVELAPQQQADLTWRMRTGHGQTGATVVTTTPGVEAGSKSSVAPSAC